MNINSVITKKKIKFINIQMIAIIGFIIALLLSYLLNYDKKMSLQNNKRLFNNNEAQKIALIQVSLVFIISMIFLYINYNQYKISSLEKGSDKTSYELQIKASIFAIISAFIGVYIVLKNYNNNLSIPETENL